MLFSIYLFCLIVGGGLVALSLMSGFGEADADAELDADMDMDADLDADADLDVAGELGGDFGIGDLDVSSGDVDFGELPFELDLEGAGIESEVPAQAGAGGGPMEYEVSTHRRFNPLVSLKFWTFMAAFFGLTGVLFEGLNLWSSAIGVFVLSLGVGLSMGLTMAYLLYNAESASGGGLTERDYLGASADVMLPVKKGETGKVRMRIDGRIIDMRAESADEGVVLDRNEKCFVLGIEDDVAKVVDASVVERELTKKE